MKWPDGHYHENNILHFHMPVVCRLHLGPARTAHFIGNQDTSRGCASLPSFPTYGYTPETISTFTHWKIRLDYGSTGINI